MKVHFLALVIIVSAASNAQASTCSKLHSLERQPHLTCHHQSNALVPETCSTLNNSIPKKALKSFNLEAMATKRCPVVPLGTKKSKCRSIRGTSLLDPQCPHAEPSALKPKTFNKSLNIQTLATKRSLFLSLEQERRECRSIRGTSLIDPQSPYAQPTASVSKKVFKPLKVHSDSPISRTSNSKKAADKAILPLSSPSGGLLALEPTGRSTCPEVNILKAASKGNSDGNVKKSKKSTCKAHIQPVFPVKA
ncbi:unnamed protein product [Umbelopsis ramanniana]